MSSECCMGRINASEGLGPRTLATRIAEASGARSLCSGGRYRTIRFHPRWAPFGSSSSHRRTRDRCCDSLPADHEMRLACLERGDKPRIAFEHSPIHILAHRLTPLDCIAMKRSPSLRSAKRSGEKCYSCSRTGKRGFRPAPKPLNSLVCPLARNSVSPSLGGFLVSDMEQAGLHETEAAMWLHRETMAGGPAFAREYIPKVEQPGVPHPKPALPGHLGCPPGTAPQSGLCRAIVNCPFGTNRPCTLRRSPSAVPAKQHGTFRLNSPTLGSARIRVHPWPI